MQRPTRKTVTQRSGSEIVTQEGGVLRAKTDDVHKAWNLYEVPLRRDKGSAPTAEEHVPEGMEGAYYL